MSSKDSQASTLSTTEVADKVNLMGMSQEKLQAFFAGMGVNPFRATHVLNLIHLFGVTDFDLMTNISKSLREKLKGKAYMFDNIEKARRFCELMSSKYATEENADTLARCADYGRPEIKMPEIKLERPDNYSYYDNTRYGSYHGNLIYNGMY